MTDLLHMSVSHSRFGVGEISAQENSTITVRFADEFGEKRFIYPWAFESFLTLSDATVRRGVAGELGALRAREADKRRQAERERQRLRDETNEKQLGVKRSADGKTPTRKTPAKKKPVAAAAEPTEDTAS